MSVIVHEHREYLSDTVRVAAYRDAIREAVRPGSVVLDLASGTGVLGLLACEAGASRVYAVEMSGMIEIGRAAAAANGYADRWVGIHGLSTDIDLPERVETIVCDQIGPFGFEAGLLHHVIDARRRFLKSGGAMVPARLDLFMAPVETFDAFAQVQFWTTRPAGFEFGPARHWAANSGYPIAFDRYHLLGSPVQGGSIDLITRGVDPLVLQAVLPIQRAGVLHGIGGWFAAQLSPSVALTNAPTAAQRINRRNAFLPIEEEVVVRPGDQVTVRVHVIPQAAVVTWTVCVAAHGVTRRFRHSTLNGLLLAREELRRMNPRFVPSLTPRGDARRLVLELCDGRRTLAEVERAVFERHGDLFATPADAQVFVGEVVTRDTRD
jgi:protein arginine N-methyltransferase 1